MSSCVILKEDQTSCQPWELNSFETGGKSGKEGDYNGVSLPTIEQVSAIQEQARQEGYDAGRAEGLDEGRKEAALETARLRNLVDAFAAEINQADEAISQQILDLSIDLARALFKSTLAVQPERIIPIVREAVRYLPAFSQPAMLYLNPGDVVLVQNGMGDELTKIGWQLTSDTQLEPGSCRVETANNQIDASLPTRWQRLTAALGKESDWLVA
jgi:flagellar assembly protein FliH